MVARIHGKERADQIQRGRHTSLDLRIVRRERKEARKMARRRMCTGRVRVRFVGGTVNNHACLGAV